MRIIEGSNEQNRGSCVAGTGRHIHASSGSSAPRRPQTSILLTVLRFCSRMNYPWQCYCRQCTGLVCVGLQDSKCRPALNYGCLHSHVVTSLGRHVVTSLGRNGQLVKFKDSKQLLNAVATDHATSGFTQNPPWVRADACATCPRTAAM